MIPSITQIELALTRHFDERKCKRKKVVPLSNDIITRILNHRYL